MFSSHRKVDVQNEEKERWRELCEQAAKEQDPTKLLLLVQEINELLKSREKQAGSPTPEDGNPLSET